LLLVDSLARHSPFAAFVRKERASIFVEAMIAIPLFLLVIFVLIYFSMVFIVRGLIDDSAQKALSYAVTHPGFEVQPLGYASQEDCLDKYSEDPFCQAVNDVIALAKQIPSGGILGSSIGQGAIAHLVGDPEVIIPVPDDIYYHVEEVYAQYPFKVVINAKLSWLIPGLSVPINAKAVGFYETHYSPSIPVEVDCHGYPYLHPSFKTQPCDCSSHPNAIFDFDSYQCHTCQFDRNSTRDPVSHYSSSTDSYGCHCPSTTLCREKYGSGSVVATVGNWQCRCLCHTTNGFVGGAESPCSCGAAPASYMDVVFQPEKVHDEANHICKCRKSDGGELTAADCKALFPDRADQVTVKADGCGCRCEWGSQPQCEGTGGTVPPNIDPATDECLCTRCAPGKVYDYDEGRCVCPNPIDCGPHGSWNEGTCSCNCTGDCNGWDVMNEDTCECNCPGDRYSCDEPYQGPSGPG